MALSVMEMMDAEGLAASYLSRDIFFYTNQNQNKNCGWSSAAEPQISIFLRVAIHAQLGLSIMPEQPAIDRWTKSGWDATGLSVGTLQAAADRMNNYLANWPDMLV